MALNNEESTKLLNLYFAIMVTMNLYEECKGISIFRQDIKMSGNSFFKKIATLLKSKFGFMFTVQTDATDNLYDHYELYIKRIATLSPSNMAVVQELLELQINNEAQFNSLCAMAKIKINKEYKN